MAIHCHPERGRSFTLVNEHRSRGTLRFCRVPIRCKILPMQCILHDVVITNVLGARVFLGRTQGPSTA